MTPKHIVKFVDEKPACPVCGTHTLIFCEVVIHAVGDAMKSEINVSNRAAWSDLKASYFHCTSCKKRIEMPDGYSLNWSKAVKHTDVELAGAFFDD